MEENTMLPEEVMQAEPCEEKAEKIVEETVPVDEEKLENVGETEKEEKDTSEETEICTEEKDSVSLDKVINSIDELSKKMDEMNTLFAQKIQHTTHEEKIVDQMHAELQKYKDDMYSQLVRPILMDIIEMRDSILRMSKSYTTKPESEQSIPLKVFSDYAYDVQDILEKNNITIYECAEGDSFSPIKQRAVKKIETSVQELHGKVAESLNPGYDYLGKIISPEKVAVYFYKESEELKGDNE